MATSASFIEFVCEQLPRAWTISYRKMFGEYMVYLNSKPILLVCDNTVFVKQLTDIQDLMVTALKGYPYKGAKEHYILDIEDSDLVSKVLTILESITPLPKPKKPKSSQKNKR